MTQHVSEVEHAEWERDRLAAAAADRMREAGEQRYVPPIWAPMDGGQFSEVRQALRGELAAQEVVSRHAARVGALRWYVEELEALLVEQVALAGEALGLGPVPVVLPRELALLRRVALELPAQRLLHGRTG